MTSFQVYYNELDNNEHVRVVVFAGPDSEHRAHAGALVLRRDEFEDFRHLCMRMHIGIKPTALVGPVQEETAP